MLHRRDFVASTTAALLAGPALAAGAWRKRAAALGMDTPRFGLVTYLWGRDLALADLLAACEARGIPAGPINTMAEVFADPQIAARGLRVDLGGVPSVRSPLVFSEAELKLERPSPRLGEDDERR